MAQTFHQEYMAVPAVTRTYTTACVLTTIAVQLDILSPFQLYFNHSLILKKYQLWRLFTNFTFFGTIGFNFIFNMIFTYRYCRMLEEGSFRGRTADFIMMFLFGGIIMTIIACFVNMVFLGQAFTIMLVYVWSKRNRNVRMNFFGMLNFNADYLPWVLFGFSLLLDNSVLVDLMGITVGHIYYYLEDVLPRIQGGMKVLRTPRLLKLMFDEASEEYEVVADETPQPGGYNWGEGPQQPQEAAQPAEREGEE